MSGDGPRVVVVGAGIAGLSAAWFTKQLLPEVDLQILEAGPEPGGKVRSLARDGRVLDLGPNGWLSGEPAMDQLLEGLGLDGALVGPSEEARIRWIFSKGRLHPAPLSPGAFLKSELLSPRGKARVLGDLFLRRGPERTTVGEFVARRFGPEVRDRMVAPMVAGIHAADPDELSLAAAFPRLAALEREHRSVVLGMVMGARGGTGKPELQTLTGGAGALTQTLAEALRDELLCEHPARALERRGSRWRLHHDHGAVEADAVILACPAPAAAAVVRGLDGDLAAPLDAIPYAPIAVLIGRAPLDTWPTSPTGFGVLADREAELGGVLGVLFTSRVFPDQAAPDEHLFRVFLGGAVHPEVVALDDQALSGRAAHALQLMLGTASSPPETLEVARFGQGIPQYTPGHSGRVRDLHRGEARHPGLFFSGNHLHGVAVKDTVRCSLEVAERAVRCLAERSLVPI